VPGASQEGSRKQQNDHDAVPHLRNRPRIEDKNFLWKLRLAERRAAWRRRRRKIALDERAWDNDKTEAAAVSQATAAAGRAAAATAGTLRIHGAACGDGCGRRGRAEPGRAGLLLRVVTLT
jgi:hypothetical protein